MKKEVCGVLILLGCLLFDTISWSQSVQHWETVVYDSMTWRYHIGTTDPGSTWYQSGFNDASWQQGRGGIGYGDGDDRTTIATTLSVFLRKKFTISNLSSIEKVIIHVDYDDGFIAYLNGVEIARSMMGSQQFVPFNQPSNGLHEALIYQGLKPDGFVLTPQQADLLVNGENTLAIQVHNDNVSSSDLSSSVFLSVGISNNSFTYLPTPSWFDEPLDFTSSNLPIIVINTGGAAIQDDPRIVADMGIIDNGPGVRNNLTDPFNNYEGKIGIELRGESSLYIFPKKSYRVETQNADGSNRNVSLLGMPAENDWVLYAPYSDKTLMRNVLTYNLGLAMGRYAPRTRFAELVLNGNYEGVYVLIEKIKVDKNRVDIAPLKPADVSGLQLTGGYLLRVDKIDGNDYPPWTATPTPLSPLELDINFQYFDPKGEDLQSAQRNYIREYMQKFQSSLSFNGFTSVDGYQQYLDVHAAIDFILVNEISKNVDAYKFSTYLYKEKDKADSKGKLVLGPLWDFNLGYGNVDYNQNAQFAPGWIWTQMERMWWMRRLLEDAYFTSRMACRWEELRSTWMTNAYFTQKIDSMAAVLDESQKRNFQRWPTLGVYVWPNQYIGQTYAQEISFLKTWILDRLSWMDSNLPGNCSLVTSVEENIDTYVDVFPNPFNNTIKVQNRKYLQFKTLQIVDARGQVIYQTVMHDELLEWNGEGRPGKAVAPGLYFIIISDERGQKILKKIIKSN